MMKVIREVSDLGGYITKKVVCVTIGLIVAFFFDYIPLVLGANSLLWFLLLLVLWLYAYAICWGVYTICTPKNKRITKSDFDSYLVSHGKEVNRFQKIKFAKVNPFARTVKYKTKLKTGAWVTYIFDIKHNILEEK